MADERKITLLNEQLRFIQLLVARNNEGVSSLDIEDLGRATLRVRMFDKSGFEIGVQTVTPRDNELPY